ncbi:MAG TPA: hypothetical protein VFW87_22085, partial [Pirellulales bacterium]|nr:hypothetical protein [Pirellulales bacterium]
MKALREYLRTYHGLPAGASDAAAKRLGRSLVRRGQLTIGEYADFFLFPDSLHDVDQIIEAVAYHEAFLT